MVRFLMVLILFVGPVLASCSKDPVSTASTNNPEVTVGLLFTHDDCDVFRFTDGGDPHYFVRCRPDEQVSMLSQHTRVISGGKSTIVYTEPEEIVTVWEDPSYAAP